MSGNHLSQYQKKALKFLVYFGGENIYQAKDVIDTKKSRFYLQDPLFELYLSRM
ncbi:MAG: hypothetical protein U9O56_08470 [Campylobacterota bacterium]|nr:hypothetical protein [Campylobacterota bacterium]